ncbi:S-adenosyl-L-methionine-dependent methyltransferase [Lophiostoma macrostomum CBS 122681]|uniref:S-adenosyl-L-methionine-dependent methyltransferase n=1 Tax=Lophiostoma macrostomum CBS 122681 TaxID=1314788 RepID=A0A6A6SUJ9_9PLEO|nr:S-adenosyl-L-methionine-dependent methyltransferase [Lophiostoma macrostomum CBS 122681]
MSLFTPKQVMPRDERLFTIIGADETLSVAQYELSLLPSIPKNAVIHDAACGLGPVTKAIVHSAPPESIKIHATDIAPQMVVIYNMIGSEHGWPAEAKVMNCERLEFADATFTHTFLSFGLPVLADPVAAVKEMYRTLKPGGIAITAFWLSIPQGEAAIETRRKVWGPDAALSIMPDPRHKDAAFIPELLVEGGFRSSDIQLYEKKTVLLVRDMDEFANAIWSVIGAPRGGWTQEDEDRWDEALSTYKTTLSEMEGYHIDEDGHITLEGIAQIAIVKKGD